MYLLELEPSFRVYFVLALVNLNKADDAKNNRNDAQATCKSTNKSYETLLCFTHDELMNAECTPSKFKKEREPHFAYLIL